MVYIRLRGELKCNFGVHLGAIPIFVVLLLVNLLEYGPKMLKAVTCRLPNRQPPAQVDT